MVFVLYLIPFLFITPSTGQVTTPQAHAVSGQWYFLQENIGISAMHMQLLRNNKVVMFDRTDYGFSNLSLPGGRCRYDPNDLYSPIDCTAHSILYDIGSNTFRALFVQTDTWCSSGAVIGDGTLVQTGGYHDGDHVVRTLTPCDGENCDWVEFPRSLAQRRWYASNQILPDGRVIIVGGRAQFNYEFHPRSSADGAVSFDFLKETRDGSSENNLYPFLHLLPDGNLFVFANTRCVVFNYKQNVVARELPPIHGGDPRNYPSSGSSVLLPIHDNDNSSAAVVAEVMICGGTSPEAFQAAKRGTFVQATNTCGRLRVTDPEPNWEIESMPIPRVMGDMLILPTGDLIIINGARSGTAGWENARNPEKRPVIYRPRGPSNTRFAIMSAAARPRLYHSSAILLTDGRILVGGSNPHIYYNFSGVEFPTDLSLESFSPPYLSVQHDFLRPRILRITETMNYKNRFSFTFTVPRFLRMNHVSIRIVAPSFTTHSFSMNQRMVVLEGLEFSRSGENSYRGSAYGPSTPEIAPSGYYLFFVVHAGIPSSGMWVKIQ